VTIEALVGALQDNPRGLLIGQDELSAWIGSFVKYAGKTGTSDLPRWLQLHHAGTINYTRKTGDPNRREVRVRGVGVSVTGTIQPKVLARVLTDEFRSSGFLARLLLAMPPWRKRQWTEAEVDEPTREAFADLLACLHCLPAGSWPNGRPCPHLVRLSDEAKRMFVAFYNANGAALETAEEDMSAVMSKLEGYALRFALIFHCCRLKEYAKDARISADDMASAVALTGWFRDEAERVYLALAEPTEVQAARHLAEVVCKLAERSEGRVTARTLQRFNSRKYPNAQSATAALEALVGLGFGRWVEVPAGPNGGPPSRAYVPCMTHDTTDPPDRDIPTDDVEGKNDVHDTTPDHPPVTEAMSGDPNVGSSSESAGYGEPAKPAPKVVSCVSCVMQGKVEPGVPVGSPPSPGGELCHAKGVVSCTGFNLVTLAEGVIWLAELVGGWSKPVGLDTETTGLDPARDRVRLVQVALGDDVAVIDLFALADPARTCAPLFAALAGKEIVGHNLQFDLRMLAPLGFIPGQVFDTMLASRVLYAGERGINNARLKHSLEETVARELGRQLDKSLQESDWSGPLTPAQLAYAAADAQVLVPLAEALKQKLADAGSSALAELEMRALPSIAWCGPVTVDADAWTNQAQAAEAELTRVQEQMDVLAPNPACLPGTESRNWNSPEDVRSAFLELGITLDSTDDGALAAIDHPLAALVRDFRGLSKRVGTYGRAWLEKHLDRNGCVLPSWNQLGTDSGRMSCSDPNLQQIPRGSDYRSCFIAAPGKVLVKADYSQIELRIAAKIADEQVMIRAYQQGGDLHRLTAARVLGKAEAEVTKADRQIAKSLNFGLLYGMGWRGLRAYALANYGVNLTDDQARAYREAFFRAYPGLRAWHQRVGDSVERQFRTDPDGTFEVRTLGGRRRALPVARKRRDGTAYPSFNDALNAPVQGTGADGLKGAIARLWETRAECPGAVPVIYCHDEIVLEVAEAKGGRAAEWLKRCMIEAVAPFIDPVPVEVEVAVSRNWAG
jgi:DNA polymerase I-like protein with 3'-5' exonuclease and polymerase domains